MVYDSNQIRKAWKQMEECGRKCWLSSASKWLIHLKIEQANSMFTSMFYVWLQISKPYFSTGEECWIWWMRRWWLCGRDKRIFSAPYRSSAFTLIWYSNILNKIKILKISENFTTIMYFSVKMDLTFNTVLFSSGMETSFMNRSHKKPLKLHSFSQHCTSCDNFSKFSEYWGRGLVVGWGGCCI